MNTIVFNNCLAKLKADSTLVGYLGSASNIVRAKKLAPAKIPGISLRSGIESSKPRPTYNTSKRRDNAPTLQVDVWVSSERESFPSTGEDADLISERVDEVLLSDIPVDKTGVWYRGSRSSQYEEDTKLFHVVLRYSFMYSVTDT